MAYDIFDLQGTPAQNAIILDALQKCSFPWEKLVAKLQATQGKTKIPVVWEDCNAYQAAAEAKSLDAHDDGHDHDHAPVEPVHDNSDGHHGDENATTHHHVEDDDGKVLAHGVGFRNRVLGLAWYSGKVSVDISLESNPEVAKEVFLAEGAHMVDFFFMTDKQRTDIFNAFHGNTTAPAEHGHDWFDKGDYYTWVGEAFMGGFIKAYSSFPVTIEFTHPPTAYVAQRIREILTPAPVAPKPTPKAPVAPAPTTAPFVSTKGSAFFHKGHKGLRPTITYGTRAEAVKARKRPCAVCKP